MAYKTPFKCFQCGFRKKNPVDKWAKWLRLEKNTSSNKTEAITKIISASSESNPKLAK